MRKLVHTLLATAALAVTAASAPARGPAPAPAPAPVHAPSARPNVVVILVDDLGWPDVSAYGRHDVETPNIDRIAHAGVAFSSGYVAASVCAVSRAGLLTGRMPMRYGYTYNINDDGNGGDEGAGIPESQKTIAERLKPLGYRSAAIGKWHVGSEDRFYPTNRGFDEFFGFLAGETIYVDPKTPGMVTTPTAQDAKKPPFDHRMKNGTILEGADRHVVNNFNRYLTDEITDHAVDFIDRSAKGKQPFFAYVAYNAPHWPLQVPQLWYDKFPQIKDPIRRTYVAMIAAMDAGVGQILDRLERDHLRDNTMVVFLADNGCPVQFGFCNQAHPWGAGKFTYLEGGVRVPFLLSWPGHLRPMGVVDTPVSSLDILPTILHAAAPRIAMPRELEGRDLFDEARHPPATPRLLVWGQAPVFAARQGDLKLWRSDDWHQTHLYDLAKDPWEKADLSSADPAAKAKLNADVEAFAKSLPQPLWKLHFTRKVMIGGRETEWVY
ncbi:sulfatase family protein [Novosphingobium rosa]|uniref:sulfatase family protein n=1 Tax=Novosphingobium rosa TaxID=76978 RepID=UPI0009FD6CE6|nr:sulfatase-like hydrolase/transferase [Novosphingobium rosa]